MNKTVAIMVVIGVLLVGAGLAMPFLGKGFGMQNTAATDALAKGDYQVYMTAIEQQWQTYKATITQDKFNQMAAQYKNMTARRDQMLATQTAINKAITDGSYTEWQTAISGLKQESKLASKITAENFGTYVQMVQAKQAGNLTEAQTLAKQLGIPMMEGRGMGMRGFHHGGFAKQAEGTQAGGGSTA